MQTLSAFLSIRTISTTILLLALIFAVSACSKRARTLPLTTQPEANDQQSVPSRQTNADVSNQRNVSRININTASPKELETLPGIGKGLADRIVEHRQRYGPFRRPEHLIIVRGISDSRFRGLRDFVTVE